MDIDFKKPDWLSNPAVISILLVIFFPVGLFFMWKNAPWTAQTKWIITGVIAFVLFVLPKKDKSEISSAASTPQVQSHSSTDADYQLGKQFQLGDYKYTIHAVRQQHSIGQFIFNEFVGEQPSPGGLFIIVRYTIENCTDESQTVIADDFKLIDARGRKFTTSSKVSTALMMHTDEKDFLFSELQPGIARRMQQGFEVPIDSVTSEIMLVIPKKGFFSTGDVRLRVRL